MTGTRWRRRDFLTSAAAIGGVAMLPARAFAVAAGGADGADLAWLDDTLPTAHEGQSWGQPWPRGTRYRSGGYALAGEGGHHEALQSWPMAWWPDGSIKWTGHALPAGGGVAKGLRVVPGASRPAGDGITLRETADAIEITVGSVRWQIGKRGEAVIRSAQVGGREVMRAVRLVASAQDRSDDDADGAATLSHAASAITAATIEQRGPVRAVVKLDGTHRGGGGDWLAFTMRLYFHAGSASVRIVHSLIFDIDPAKLFVRGLGLEGQVPLSDPLHDRHVRFAGEKGGLWGEGIRPLTGLRRDPGAAFRAAQVAGKATPPLASAAPAVRDEAQYITPWGDFRLRQPNADGFAITKRTGPGHGWIDVDTAGRAPGLGYIGGASGGGVAFAMHDFWQRPPVGLDVAGATGDAATFTLWYHAPDAPAMDLRFYHDTEGMADYAHQNLGLDITYEDFEPGWGDAHGIARTTEFRLWALPATPERDRLVEMAALVAQPPRLVARPERVHAAELFGIWGPVQQGGPLRARIEGRAKRELDFYIGQVDQRRWYGFWNYGDVMHTYDTDRHIWRYDIGGFAWDNSELSTDLWLWYAFLRDPRADVFRMAEAMTRHTGEVDVYHTGRFKGLGTRHGVQHWGDSSKQQRVSNAAFRRIYYYLTTDERCGDLMRELLDSDRALLTVNIGRKVEDRTGDNRPPGGNAAVSGGQLPAGQVFMSFGTSWAALVAAWLTEWERTRDPHWRDRIIAGMRSIAALPKGWFAGGAPFDLASGRFVGGGTEVSISHLNGVFGIFEITAELLKLVDVPAYRETWLDYCAFYNAPAEAFRAKTGASGKGRGLTQAHSRYTAYAAVERRDPALAQRALAEFLGSGDRAGRDPWRTLHHIDGAAVLKPVDELSDVSTNDAAQWGLAATANLVLLGDLIDKAG
jgi:hypothetical protein